MGIFEKIDNYTAKSSEGYEVGLERMEFIYYKENGKKLLLFREFGPPPDFGYILDRREITKWEEAEGDLKISKEKAASIETNIGKALDFLEIPYEFR